MKDKKTADLFSFADGLLDLGQSPEVIAYNQSRGRVNVYGDVYCMHGGEVFHHLSDKPRITAPS